MSRTVPSPVVNTASTVAASIPLPLGSWLWNSKTDQLYWVASSIRNAPTSFCVANGE